METKFQTSFIPRKPISSTPGSIAPQLPKKQHDLSGLFMSLAVVVFIISLLGLGGAYLWKSYLTGATVENERLLAERHKDFNLAQISLVKAQTTKITLAKQLLANHLATSKIFSIISQLTSENVRFLSLSLGHTAGGSGPLTLALTGYGRDFPAVAFQSDVLNQLEKYHLGAVIKNAIVSDPNLNRNGTVSFGFTAQIDPSALISTATAAPVAPASSDTQRTSTTTNGQPSN